MKKQSFILAFIMLFLHNLYSQTQKSTTDGPLYTTSEAIAMGQSKMKDLLTEYPGLSITVGIKDSIIWSEGFGYADVSKNELVSAEHQFRFYSISKSITGMMLIKLMESGQIDMETSVRQYLPNLPEAYHSVLIQHLIAHTAGIRNYNKGEWLKISQDNCETAQDALSTFINDPLISTPGQSSAYSSFGYVLLSAVIESVTGKSYLEYLKTMILAPVGVNSISMNRVDQLNEVTYYEEWNSKKAKGKVAREINNSCKNGAGGLVGTTKDFVRLHLAMLSNQVSTEAFTATYYKSLMQSNGEAINYAFGIGDNINQNGVRTHGHSGSGIGGNAVFLVYPERQLVIAIAGSIESKGMNEKISEIAKLFLELKS
jgi:serine beta-lactamase-like protein LACTB, mitochondrial